jgi:hypothetical protein
MYLRIPASRSRTTIAICIVSGKRRASVLTTQKSKDTGHLQELADTSVRMRELEDAASRPNPAISTHQFTDARRIEIREA